MVPFLGGRGLSMPKAVATSTAIGLPVSLLGAVVYMCRTSPEPRADMIGYLCLPAFLGLSARRTARS